MDANFSKDRLILNIAANLKSEIERFHTKDKKAIGLINDLVYHLAFKINEKEQQDGFKAD